MFFYKESKLGKTQSFFEKNFQIILAAFPILPDTRTSLTSDSFRVSNLLLLP